MEEESTRMSEYQYVAFRAIDSPVSEDNLEYMRQKSLRAEILDGDLRPLYLAHLAISCDGNHDPEATKEAPIPAGLDKVSDAQRALMELYGLSDSLITAAAQDSPSLKALTDPRSQHAQ